MLTYIWSCLYVHWNTLHIQSTVTGSDATQCEWGKGRQERNCSTTKHPAPECTCGLVLKSSYSPHNTWSSGLCKIDISKYKNNEHLLLSTIFFLCAVTLVDPMPTGMVCRRERCKVLLLEVSLHSSFCKSREGYF